MLSPRWKLLGTAGRLRLRSVPPQVNGKARKAIRGIAAPAQPVPDSSSFDTAAGRIPPCEAPVIASTITSIKHPLPHPQLTTK